ncbi:NUDIX hydrolase [Sinirhodobacter huangdaonensis]|jgi:8-oxo-dGTP pyrophosphatase MutT (NUDIX family)|uniref:NUDIX hydrolase n=1 Tax=Paenirhodobacter huangdaonensis TaxID=2501515 RepID=A0A443LR79_9RHOB|nr:NUDIX hydrolase [Sinirhodobacter huangdaonensis]RWR51670.1 NUDIX hydrolase [Sinirhodobacter huangdaonensis]
MKFERKLALLRDAQGAVPVQFAALCTRRKAGRIEVLLITSRDTGRWILPKGWPMAGKSGGETALTEAWEEAGVVGHLAGAALGSYGALKELVSGKPMPSRVEVHPVRVERLAAKFPEKGQRRRKWMTAKKAAKSVAEPELAALLRALPRG